MINKIKDFMSEQTQTLADQAQKMRKEPAAIAREAARKSAEGTKSLNDPIRASRAPGSS